MGAFEPQNYPYPIAVVCRGGKTIYAIRKKQESERVGLHKRSSAGTQKLRLHRIHPH